MEENKPETSKPVTAQPPVSETANKLDTKIPKRKLPILLIGTLAGVVVVLIILGLIFTSGGGVKKGLQENARNNYQEGKYDESAKIAKDALKKFPNDKYLLRIVLDAASSKANSTGTEDKTFEENKTYIEEAKKLADKDFELLISLGYAHETAGKYEEALSYYEKALAINDKSSSANFHKGHVLKFLNRLDEARIFITKAYELEPDNGYFQLAVGNLYFEEGKKQEALALYIMSGENEKSPKAQRAEAYVAAAWAYAQGNQLNDALTVASKAVELDPSNSMALALNGFSYVLLMDPAKGAPLLNRAIKQNPRITLNYMMQGVSLRMVGFYDDAAKTQQYGIDNVGKDNTLVGDKRKTQALGQMYFELSETYSLANDETNSVKYLALALKTNPAIRQNLPAALAAGYFKNVKNSAAFGKL